MADAGLPTQDTVDPEDPGSPLCLTCGREVDPLDTVCPHCGAAVGQFVPYLPLESVRWEMAVWGRMWHQVEGPRGSGVSLVGRVFRFAVIVFYQPLLLLLGFGPLILKWVRRKADAG